MNGNMLKIIKFFSWNDIQYVGFKVDVSAWILPFDWGTHG